MKKALVRLFLLLLSALSTPAFAANPCGFSGDKIMHTIKYPPAAHDLVIVVAHRGIHGILQSDEFKSTPENTRESLDNTDQKCFEAAEIDVRLSGDNIPMISHDTNWGREARTPDGNGACCFNPYDQAKPGYNPAVNQISASQAGSYVIRPTTNLYAASDEKASTLTQMLQYYQSRGFQFILFIDVKDAKAFDVVWQTVAALHMTNRVVLKLAANVIPDPALIVNHYGSTHYACLCKEPDTAYMNIMPVYQTGDIAANNGFGAPAGESKLVDSVRKWAGWNGPNPNQPFVAGVEINIKERGAILKDVMIAARSYGITVANFQPVGEYSNGQSSGYFYWSDGHCCAQLGDFYFHGTGGLPSDRHDDRPFMDFIKDHVDGNYVNMITTDNPVLMANTAQSWSKRATTKYFK